MKISATKDEARNLRIALKIWRDSCKVGPSFDAYPGEWAGKKWKRAYRESQKDYKIVLSMLKVLKGK